MDHSSKRNQFIVGDYCQLPPVGGSICDSIIYDHDFASTDTFLDSLVCISTSPPWLHVLIKLLRNLRHGDNLNGDNLNKILLALSRSHLSMMDYNTTSQNF